MVFVITSLGEEIAGLCASHTFVCLFCMRYFCPLSLPFGVRGWLRFVIVALPKLFYYVFYDPTRRNLNYTKRCLIHVFRYR